MSKNQEDYQGLKKAIALGYSPQEDFAPRVLSSGKGETARKIVDIAKEEGIQVYEDRELADNLSALDIGETIPEELYEAVAEVLAFIYRIELDEEGLPCNNNLTQ